MSQATTTEQGTAAWLRERGGDSWRQAVDHPMVAEIGAGTLPHEKFYFYFTQNIRYLEDYARAIAAVMAKAPDTDAMDVLSRFLDEILSTELPANDDFLTRLSAEVGWEKPSPGTGSGPRLHLVAHGYTRHLLYATTSGSCAAGLAAVLPCQWSYGELAKPLREAKPADPIYADWIDLFGDDSYDDLVGETTGLLDRLADDASPAERDRLLGVFEMSTRWEIAFWDMAYDAGAGDGAM